MRSVLATLLVCSLLVGCDSGNPPQPTLSEGQVQDVMKQGKQQSQREGGDRIPKQR
ncbi:MAG: hypothetical protein MUF18_12800 [Fimbriiglobus sp.]|jgi:hypothetical protein|nr:hypothetical protein [Fimbriiglobus sp.]